VTAPFRAIFMLPVPEASLPGLRSVVKVRPLSTPSWKADTEVRQEHHRIPAVMADTMLTISAMPLIKADNSSLAMAVSPGPLATEMKVRAADLTVAQAQVKRSTICRAARCWRFVFGGSAFTCTSEQGGRDHQHPRFLNWMVFRQGAVCPGPRTECQSLQEAWRRRRTIPGALQFAQTHGASWRRSPQFGRPERGGFGHGDPALGVTPLVTFG